MVLFFSGFFIGLFQPAAFLQFLVQDPFDLPVDTAELVRCPFFQGLVGIIINTDDKTFFRTHGSWFYCLIVLIPSRHLTAQLDLQN